ncbi:MbcA/ParS/Xre antitoxin family protein [Simiduia sp. 21SJ11W-1]|uniref:MbcA/ParS/Xre antitoxin family protein n=1 Tax=Simiduia sp. 21SJ11W-1 TaxID=2909669 RepID=UPI00209CDC65|nr:MbcA/ParS/Xre antitoxin family protein [Simiduia sp. 21SJ11W-1]UTA49058.1 MbcA/ParS/Xre antitoxin family protein [Simiduia sp. 21SJ11W-1]
MSALQMNQPEAAAVLCKALQNTQQAFGLTNEELGRIIGKDRSTIGRMFDKGQLSPGSKEGELALLLVRVYRSLFALLGGSQSQMQHWLNTANSHLQATPRSMMSSVQGLVNLVTYLDAMRGRV